MSRSILNKIALLSGCKLATVGPFTYTGICNLAFIHKGFGFNNFSIVFFLTTFQGIIAFQCHYRKDDSLTFKFDNLNNETKGISSKNWVIKPLTA